MTRIGIAIFVAAASVGGSAFAQSYPEQIAALVRLLSRAD